MRPFEIAIPILLAAYLLWPLSNRLPSRLVKLLPAAAALATVLHLFIEHSRWQMIPLYVLAGTLFFASLLTWKKATQRPANRSRTELIAGLLLLAAATALPILLPVPQFTAPTGPYAVGTKIYALTDTSRPEIYSSLPNQPRKFIVQIWYPAKPGSEAQRAPWIDGADVVAPSLADWIGLPHFFLNQISLAKSNSYQDASSDTSGAPYPLLVFSHGWDGFRTQNLYQVQELASHGYIVVSVEHPYGAVATVFPDGNIAYNYPAALPTSAPPDLFQAAAHRLIQQWSGDISYTLDFMNQLNQNDPDGLFTNTIDMNKIGVFGHSLGGGASIEFCGTDLRCKAGLTEDAYMAPVTPDVLSHGTQQPFLYMFSQQWLTQDNIAAFNQYYGHVAHSNRVITILGSNHDDFTDLPALTPLASFLGLKGPINSARAQQIIDAYSLAFFDQTLKGAHTTLLDGPSPNYPEVHFDQ